MDTLGTCELRCLGSGCGLVIRINDSVEMTTKGWMHKACARREMPVRAVADEEPVVLEPPADPSRPIDVLDEIAVTVSRMLNVPGDPTDEAWRDHRAANITHVLGTHFQIERRT